MLYRKHYIIGIVSIIMLIIFYVIMGRLLPIHVSSMKVGSERVYYQEISRFIQCDVAYDEMIVHEDGTYTYVYELVSIGNGSCISDLYVWDNFKYYTLSEAIDLDIVPLEDFLESDVVIKRLIINTT